MEIELNKFDINYKPQTTIKEQALVDFIAKFTYTETSEDAGAVNDAEAPEDETAKNKAHTETLEYDDHGGKKWKLFVNDSSNEGGAKA